LANACCDERVINASPINPMFSFTGEEPRKNGKLILDPPSGPEMLTNRGARLPGDAAREKREAGSFREMRVRKSPKPFFYSTKR